MSSRSRGPVTIEEQLADIHEQLRRMQLSVTLNADGDLVVGTGTPGPPGTNGVDGTDGATGATGPAGPAGTSATIPQLDVDPVAPDPEDAWVLHSSTPGGGGQLMFMVGLSTPITTVGVTVDTYQFSYRTLEGTTERVTLS